MLFGKTHEDLIKHSTALKIAADLLAADPNFVQDAADEYLASLRYNEIETYHYLALKDFIYRPIAERWEKQ